MARREAMGLSVGFCLLAVGVGVPESLAAAHQITATVINEAQMPLVGITVELRLHDGTVMRSQHTNSNGVARFSRMPDGDYRVVPRSKGYLFTPEAQDVSLTPASGNVTLPPFVGAATYVGARWVVPSAIEF